MLPACALDGATPCVPDEDEAYAAQQAALREQLGQGALNGTASCCVGRGEERRAAQSVSLLIATVRRPRSNTQTPRLFVE
jgi:hypothetical protein